VSSNTYRTLNRVEFTPDGRSVVGQEYGRVAQSLRIATIQWDLDSDQPGRTVWEIHQMDNDMPVKVTDTYRYSPAAHAAAWANRNGLQLQRDGGAVVTLAPASTSQIIDMAFSADGRMLAASDNGGSTRLFSITPTTATLIQTLVLGQGYGLDGAVFSPDGTLFGIPDGGVGKVWRVGEPSPFVQFGFEQGETGNAINRFIIVPDKQLLIAVEFSNITLYRLSDGVRIGTLPVSGWSQSKSTLSYEDIAITPTGDQLAITNDGRILIWDIGS
jgi:WD40 repeat protein